MLPSRSRQTIDLPERLPADRLALDCEAAALTIGKPETASAELLSQDPAVLAQVLDDVELLPAHPTRVATSRALSFE